MRTVFQMTQNTLIVSIRRYWLVPLLYLARCSDFHPYFEYRTVSEIVTRLERLRDRPRWKRVALQVKDRRVLEDLTIKLDDAWRLFDVRLFRILQILITNGLLL